MPFNRATRLLLAASLLLIAGVFLALNPSFPARAMRSLVAAERRAAPAGTTDLPLTFTHPEYPFSLRHPAGLTFRYGPDQGGAVVLFQDHGRVVFQVFLTPYSGPEPLTPELLRQEFPDRVMDGVQALTLPDGTRAVAFHSIDLTAGPYSEVSFTHSGYAYHVAAERAHHALVERILTETWWFE